MLLVLSYEAPDWRVYAMEAKIEASGASLDEAFAAFYNALNSEDTCHVEVVHDFSNPAPGIYRIRVAERPDGGLTVYSQDILGLSYGGDNAEEVLLRLPGAIGEILSKQDHHSRTA